MTRDEWIKSFNSQCIVTIVQLLWTKECEMRITDKKPYAALDEYNEIFTENLLDYTKMLTSKPSLSKDVRGRVIAVITGEVHNQDVVKTLRDDKVCSMDDFTWKRQLRFYNENKLIKVEQANSIIMYG